MNPALRAEPLVSGAQDRMIFVTGASRSGTTLLSFVLRSHSRVLGLPELQYFGDFVDPRRRETHPVGERQLLQAATALYERHERGVRMAALQSCDADEIQLVARLRARALVDGLTDERRDPYGVFADATGRLARAAGKAIPCEQTPRNIFYAEALLDIYPQARFVHMMRDPRAVMASQKKRWKRRRLLANRAALPPSDALRSWVNYHPYTMGSLWAKANAEAYRLRSHPRFRIIRFEDLLAQPEATVREVCEHLDLAYEPAMLDVPQINSSHASSASGARRGFNPEAIDAWKKTLGAGEIAVTERLCRAGMALGGYPPLGQRARTGELRYAMSYVLHAAGVITLNPRRAWIQLRALTRVPLRSSAPGR